MTTPIFSPLYQPFPWTYSGGRIMSFTVQCDPSTLAAMVPPPLKIDDSGLAQIWCLEFPVIAGCGAYNEFLMLTSCTLAGEQGAFNVWIYVDNDAALGAGREIAGIPKKIAHIDVTSCNDQRLGRVTRSGVEFARVGMTFDTEGDRAACESAAEAFAVPAWNFRHIPGIDGEGGPICSQITETRMSGHVHKIIYGRGFVDFSPSAADPLWHLKPKVTEATYMELDLILPLPKLKRDLLANDSPN